MCRTRTQIIDGHIRGRNAWELLFIRCSSSFLFLTTEYSIAYTSCVTVMYPFMHQWAFVSSLRCYQQQQCFYEKSMSMFSLESLFFTFWPCSMLNPLSNDKTTDRCFGFFGVVPAQVVSLYFLILYDAFMPVFVLFIRTKCYIHIP